MHQAAANVFGLIERQSPAPLDRQAGADRGMRRGRRGQLLRRDEDAAFGEYGPEHAEHGFELTVSKRWRRAIEILLKLLDDAGANATLAASNAVGAFGAGAVGGEAVRFALAVVLEGNQVARTFGLIAVQIWGRGSAGIAAGRFDLLD